MCTSETAHGCEHETNVDDLEAMSDAALVVAVGRWHREALAEIYRRHAGAVFGLARQVVGSEDLAQDVVQEVFLRLWDRPERYDPERGSLRSYVLADCHGRSVDLVRSERARKQREERDARLTAEGGYDIDRELWDTVVGEHVRQALRLLSDRQREAIHLAYFGGHTYRDVAAVLGEPEGTVKSWIRTGLARLRTELAEAGVGWN